MDIYQRVQLVAWPTQAQIDAIIWNEFRRFSHNQYSRIQNGRCLQWKLQKLGAQVHGLCNGGFGASNSGFSLPRRNNLFYWPKWINEAVPYWGGTLEVEDGSFIFSGSG